MNPGGVRTFFQLSQLSAILGSEVMPLQSDGEFCVQEIQKTNVKVIKIFPATNPITSNQHQNELPGMFNLDDNSVNLAFLNPLFK